MTEPETETVTETDSESESVSNISNNPLQLTASELGYEETPYVFPGWNHNTDGEPEIWAQETPFKALSQNGQFIWVVGDDYKLLPNEHVKAAVAAAVQDLGLAGVTPRGYKPMKWCLVEYYDSQVKDSISEENVQIGFTVTNSMNMKLTLDIRTTISIPGVGLLVGKSVYQHRHTKNMLRAAKVSAAAIYDSEKLLAIIKAAIGASQEWASNVQAYKDVNPKDWSEQMDALSEALPNKYLPSYLDKKELGGGLKAELWPSSMWEVFKDVVRNVWMGEIQEKTRLMLMERITDIFEPIKFTSALY